jgi:hypothetical protein
MRINYYIKNIQIPSDWDKGPDAVFEKVTVVQKV